MSPLREVLKLQGSVVPFDEIDVLAVESEALEAVVGAVGDDEDGRRSAGIDDDAVRAIQLTGFLALTAEGADVLRRLALYWLM